MTEEGGFSVFGSKPVVRVVEERKQPTYVPGPKTTYMHKKYVVHCPPHQQQQPQMMYHQPPPPQPQPQPQMMYPNPNIYSHVQDGVIYVNPNNVGVNSNIQHKSQIGVGMGGGGDNMKIPSVPVSLEDHIVKCIGEKINTVKTNYTNFDNNEMTDDIKEVTFVYGISKGSPSSIGKKIDEEGKKTGEKLKPHVMDVDKEELKKMGVKRAVYEYTQDIVDQKTGISKPFDIGKNPTFHEDLNKAGNIVKFALVEPPKVTCLDNKFTFRIAFKIPGIKDECKTLSGQSFAFMASSSMISAKEGNDLNHIKLKTSGDGKMKEMSDNDKFLCLLETSKVQSLIEPSRDLENSSFFNYGDLKDSENIGMEYYDIIVNDNVCGLSKGMKGKANDEEKMRVRLTNRDAKDLVSVPKEKRKTFNVRSSFPVHAHPYIGGKLVPWSAVKSKLPGRLFLAVTYKYKTLV